MLGLEEYLEPLAVRVLGTSRWRVNLFLPRAAERPLLPRSIEVARQVLSVFLPLEIFAGRASDPPVPGTCQWLRISLYRRIDLPRFFAEPTGTNRSTTGHLDVPTICEDQQNQGMQVPSRTLHPVALSATFR